MRTGGGKSPLAGADLSWLQPVRSEGHFRPLVAKAGVPHSRLGTSLQFPGESHRPTVLHPGGLGTRAGPHPGTESPEESVWPVSPFSEVDKPSCDAGRWDETFTQSWGACQRVALLLAGTAALQRLESGLSPHLPW